MVEIAFLLLIGLAGGIITSLVGGASVVTFPGLIAAGLSPVDAAIVSLVGLTPANIGAAVWDRGQLPRFTRPLWISLGICVAGSALGAWLLLLTPGQMFATLVPALLGLATALFGYAGRIGAWIVRNAKSDAAADASRWTATMAGLVPVSIYGGYFGAGAGVMLLAVFMLVSRGDYRGANALKNLVAGVNCLVATAIYVVQDAVVWRPTLVLMTSAILGSWIGVSLVRVAPRELLRRTVIALGIVLSAVFAWKYWF